MAIAPLTSNQINPNTDMKNKINEVVAGIAGDSAEFNTQMEAWLASLPTADPSVAGEAWLDTGVLTVSAG